MKKKKVITGIVIVLILAIIVLLVTYFTLNKKKDTATDNIVINISELNKDILDNSEFADMQMQDITKDFATSTFQINNEDIKEIVGKIPLIGTKSSMYVLIEPNENKANEIKAKLETYAKDYEKQWSNYLEDQYDLVRNRRIGIRGNIVYMFISDNVEALVNLIK